MRIYRKTQMLTIVALVIAIVTLGVGFAAFSSTLNISSSASVSPNSDDFSVTIYGFKDKKAVEDYSASNGEFNLEYFDSLSAFGLSSVGNTVQYERAIIDNSNYSITIPEIKIFEEVSSVTYHFVIMNDGEYDVYVDLSDYNYDRNADLMFKAMTGICTPGEGTSLELTNAACSSIILQPCFAEVGKCVMNTDEGYYLIPKGEFGVLSIVAGSTTFTKYADGPFSVKFPEHKLNISTTK
jgi:hypothetical protein